MMTARWNGNSGFDYTFTMSWQLTVWRIINAVLARQLVNVNDDEEIRKAIKEINMEIAGIIDNYSDEGAHDELSAGHEAMMNKIVDSIIAKIEKNQGV